VHLFVWHWRLFNIEISFCMSIPYQKYTMELESRFFLWWQRVDNVYFTSYLSSIYSKVFYNNPTINLISWSQYGMNIMRQNFTGAIWSICFYTIVIRILCLREISFYIWVYGVIVCSFAYLSGDHVNAIVENDLVHYRESSWHLGHSLTT